MLSKEIQTGLHKEMVRLEGLHEQEETRLQEIKTRYEVKGDSNASKIQHLKSALKEMKANTEMSTECIWTLLHSHKERFTPKFKEEMDRQCRNINNILV